MNDAPILRIAAVLSFPSPLSIVAGMPFALTGLRVVMLREAERSAAAQRAVSP